MLTDCKIDVCNAGTILHENFEAFTLLFVYRLVIPIHTQQANVYGDSCDTCRPGFFRLTSANPDGCLECWCSGVTSECFSSNYYRIELPMQLFADHGFSFSDR